MDKKQLSKIGFHFSMGFFQALGAVLILGWMLGRAGNMLEIGLDDTDASNWHRSGMEVHLDHRTGCHYLRGESGGLTPRLNRDGTQVCD